MSLETDNWIASSADLILVTGANGFVGIHVVRSLIERGFTRIRCMIRSLRNVPELEAMADKAGATLEILRGSLASREDCARACDGVRIVYHLAVGSTGKSFPGAVMNVVIPTRNLLDAVVKHGAIRRFVNVSSFAIYSNRKRSKGKLVDETCSIEERPQDRGDAYAYAKLKQDQIVSNYGKQHGFEFVIVRPGVVYGPGKNAIPGRVGINTFGFFMHLGGNNSIPLTYVTNCAEAVVLSGLVPGVGGEVFNIVDDNLPTSRQFLNLYKNNVKTFRSVYLPHLVSYLFCFLWERYATLSKGQLPPLFSRAEWHAYWKASTYSNEKIKKRLGWKMSVATEEGLKRYFAFCRAHPNA